MQNIDKITNNQKNNKNNPKIGGVFLVNYPFFKTVSRLLLC